MNKMAIDKIDFIKTIRHYGWICFQMAANQPYNIEMTEDQKISMRNAVIYALENPDMTPEENHINWIEMKKSQGWIYGKVKDFNLKTHPDLIPFVDLPKIEQLKDEMDRLMNKLGLQLWEQLFE